jgi:hypothetical protein
MAKVVSVLGAGAVCALGSLCAGADAPMPVNIWVPAEVTTNLIGTSAGLVYLPEQKAFWQWGPNAEFLFNPDARRLEAKGPGPKQGGRGKVYTEWKNGVPVIPGYNRGCWVAHQFCYLPEEKKALYFIGGSTFKVNPADSAKPENMNISFGKAPPDVMLGSMAWDPLHKEAILFGGGYLQAHAIRATSIMWSQPEVPDAWKPADWDRRGTWAYNPAKNEWRKLATAAKPVCDAYERCGKLADDLHALWGATRGIAFEYGDLVTGKSAPELGKAVDGFAGVLAAFGKEIGGKGDDAYEKWQFSTAAGICNGAVSAGLKEASTALAAGDGWKAFRALDQAEEKLGEAREALAYAPPPRHYARLVTDPVNRVMVLWGGDGEDRWLADTWMLHLDTGRWERCRVEAHPPAPKSSMLAMDYDEANRVVVLAHPDGSLWCFDAAKRSWSRIEAGGESVDKKRPAVWMSLAYAPDKKLHVLSLSADSLPYKKEYPAIRMLQLDLSSAKLVAAKAGESESVWRDGYGGGCPADKYHVAWSFLPKTQAEYREKVAARQKEIAAMPDNTWTELKSPYAGWGRAWGSFAYDWDRDEIHIIGGGHSAYQGVEWSQYDLKSGLWMESWNPDYPPAPYGSPDGFGWGPRFKDPNGNINHGYHFFAYWGATKKVLFTIEGAVVGGNPEQMYDPDRMRWAQQWVTEEPSKTVPYCGMQVEMNGDPRAMCVVATGYSKPGTVFVVNEKTWTIERIKGSAPPFEMNNESMAVMDTKRNRLLYFGAQGAKPFIYTGLYAYDIASNKWEKLEPKIEPEGAPAPATTWWNYCYSAKYDCLFLAAKEGTWVYSCEKNVWTKLPCKPQVTQAGVAYSAKQDLFVILENNGYAPQRVWAFRYKP